MRFEFCNPTRVIFGCGVTNKIGEEARKLGKRILLVTGKGSIKKTGIFDKVMQSLLSAQCEVEEFSGVEPNPRLSTVKKGGEIAKRCDVVVAVGGGSVMDAAKVIAAIPFYDLDPWAMIYHGQDEVRLPQEALPIITVPTLAATGSEMNSGAVITNEHTKEKSYVIADCLYPRTTLVDPENTVTVPPNHTAFGIADLITHVTESYFNGVDGTPLQDRMAEGVILTTLEYAKRAVQNGRDIEARTQIQWASVVALNGWVQAGTSAPFPVHQLEHVVSAHSDIPHGAGLAILSPKWMRFACKKRPKKFVQFANRIFDIKGNDQISVAMEGISKLEDFFKDIGCPSTLSEVGISEQMIKRFTEDVLRISGRGGILPSKPPATFEDVYNIFRDCL